MARPKRRHSSPTRAAGPSILGDGLMLSGTRAEFSASRPARPGSLPREAQAQAELQTHDYLRKGVASTARVRSGSRRRDVNSLENGRSDEGPRHHLGAKASRAPPLVGTS